MYLDFGKPSEIMARKILLGKLIELGLDCGFGCLDWKLVRRLGTTASLLELRWVLEHLAGGQLEQTLSDLLSQSIAG